MKRLLLLLTVCPFVGVFSQSFTSTTIHQSEKNIYPIVKFGSALFTVDYDWDGLSGFSANLKRFIHTIQLKKLDNSLKVVNQKMAAGGEKIFGPVKPDLRVINGELYLLYYKMPSKNGLKLFCAKVDTASLQISNDQEILDINVPESDLKFYMRSLSLEDNNNTILRDYNYKNAMALSKTFFWETSPDFSRSVVVWNSGYDKNYTGVVLDKNLKVVKKIFVDLKEYDEVRINDIHIDNSGNVVFAYNHIEKDVNKATFYIIRDKGEVIKKPVELPVDNPFGSFSAFYPDGKKLFVCGGYKEKGEFLKGVYSFEFTIESGTISNILQTPYPENLIAISEKEGWGYTKVKYKGISDNLFMRLYPLADGRFLLAGEFKRAGSLGKNTGIASGSMINTLLTANTATFSRLPKCRWEFNRIYSAYPTIIEHDKKIFIFYNDHIKNFQKPIDEPTYEPTIVISGNDPKMLFAVATLEYDGSLNRKIIMEESPLRFFANTDSPISLSLSSFIIPFYRSQAGGRGVYVSDYKWELISIN